MYEFETTYRKKSWKIYYNVNKKLIKKVYIFYKKKYIV